MSEAELRPEIIVRNTRPEDFAQIIDLTREVYHDSPSWKLEQLASHLAVFPDGQFVAVEKESDRVVGMAASLIVDWDDYDMGASWRDFTDHGTFQNHNPVTGRTLYGAEVMVRPSEQGRGIGKKIYAARRELVRRMGLLRIRAGARLCGYHLHADRLTPEKYVLEVLAGRLSDPDAQFSTQAGLHPAGGGFGLPASRSGKPRLRRRDRMDKSRDRQAGALRRPALQPA